MSRVIVPSIFCMILLVFSAGAPSGDLEPAIKLYQSGKISEAMDRVNAVLKKKPTDLSALFLRGLIRFQDLNAYEQAVLDFTSVIDNQARTGESFPPLPYAVRNRGISFFLLGQNERALTDLRRGVLDQPGNAHGYLLWYLVARRAGPVDNNLLVGYPDPGSEEWPVPLIRLYRGLSSPQECLRLAKVDDEKTTRGNLCEAYFYIGEYYLFRNEAAKAREYFGKCVKTGITTFSEYQLALWELSRLSE